MENKILKREEVPIELTWDLETIFKNDQIAQEKYQQLEADISKIEAFKDNLCQNPQNLLNGVECFLDLYRRLTTLYVYAHLKNDQDTKNDFYKTFYEKMVVLYSKLSSACAFVEVSILEQDYATIQQFIQQEPKLKPYEHFFEEMFRNKKYVLSDKEEALLATLSPVLDTGSHTFSILNNADLVFPNIEDENGNSVPLTHSRYGLYLESKNKDVRKNAFNAMYDTYAKLQNTIAALFSSNISLQNINARLRGFKSSRHQHLYSNAIDESVYDALIQAVNEKLPLLHQYVELRKQILQLSELEMADMYVPLIDEVPLKFSYEEAKQITLEALLVLGEEYIEIVKKAFNERWIDVVENDGKRSGAYSSGSYDTNPFILLNWQDNLSNLYTLVHEMGHSLHSYYTRKYQPYVYGSYSIFLAEIASTTNENLLTAYLLEKYKDNKKLVAYVLNHYLDGIKGTLFRQTQFAEFENVVHSAQANGQILSCQYLNDTYFNINKKYYGENVNYDQRIALEWSRIPHFYSSFYVYQYATGISAASVFAKRILDKENNAVENYINFLKAGNSDYPLNVLLKSGLDMSNPEAIYTTLNLFDERLQQLKTLI